MVRFLLENCNHSATDISICLDHIVDLFDRYQIKVVGFAADGGAPCQTALKKWMSKRRIGSRWFVVYPFSDFDHLIKTIRNRLHAGEIKTNMQKVKWQILNDEYVHFPHDLKASIHLDAIRLKDKMNSKHLRMICSAQLSQYLFQKANTKAGDEKRDYQNLSMFLLKLSTYLMVFSPSNNLDNATRYQQLHDATEFLIGNCEYAKVTGMSQNALDSLVMNKKSFRLLMNEKDLADNVDWSKFSSFALERLFSIARARNNSPSSQELGADLNKIAAQSHRESLGREGLGFSPGRRKTIYSEDSKGTSSISPEKSTLVYVGPQGIKKRGKLTCDDKILKLVGQKQVNMLKNTHKEKQLTLRASQRTPIDSSGKIKKISTKE
jgi:hypothetical protein